MTITSERPATVAVLQSKREAIEHEIAANGARDVELAREQDAARKAELLGEKRPGTTSKTIARKRQELAEEKASLEQDLVMVVDLLITETHVETQVKIVAAMEQAEQMKQVERRLWKDVVTAFEAFGTAWLALASHYRKWAEVRGSHH